MIASSKRRSDRIFDGRVLPDGYLSVSRPETLVAKSHHWQIFKIYYKKKKKQYILLRVSVGMRWSMSVHDIINNFFKELLAKERDK